MPQAQQGMNITDTAQINPGVVESADIALDTIADVDIAEDAVGASEIKPDSITNTEIKSNAAIDDSKLGTINDAGKVDGAALTGLANIPAGAGVIPAANLPVAAGDAGVFIPASAGFISTGTISVDGVSKMLGVDFPDGTTYTFTAWCKVPAGYTSISSIKYIGHVDDNSGNFVLRTFVYGMNTDAESNATLDETGTDVQDAVGASSRDIVITTANADSYSAIGTIDGNDIICVRVSRQTGAAGDTTTGTYKLIGILVTFA